MTPCEMTANPPMITNSTWAPVKRRKSSAKLVIVSLRPARLRSLHLFGEFEQPKHRLHALGGGHALGLLELGGVDARGEAIQNAILPGLIGGPPHDRSLCSFLTVRTAFRA